MSAALELPVFLINDVRAFTVAELEIGAAKGVQTALCYAIGTGIGGGIVAHGRVNMGLGGAGGELGHMIVNTAGAIAVAATRVAPKPTPPDQPSSAMPTG